MASYGCTIACPDGYISRSICIQLASWRGVAVVLPTLGNLNQTNRAASIGVATSAGGAKLRTLENRLSQLTPTNKEANPIVEWHANAVEIYKKKIADLQVALTADEIVRQEASEALRRLIDKIVVYSAERRGQFDLALHGYLAAALALGKCENSGGARSHQRTGLPRPKPNSLLARESTGISLQMGRFLPPCRQ